MHEHWYEPTELMQDAFVWQELGDCPHSFMSKLKKIWIELVFSNLTQKEVQGYIRRGQKTSKLFSFDSFAWSAAK